MEDSVKRERIKKILFYDWDPIGINDVPDAEDEYDSYANEIYSLLINDTPEQIIAEFLSLVEENSIGLNSRKDVNKLIAKKIFELWLQED